MGNNHHDLILYRAAIQRLRDSGRYGTGEAFSRWLETEEGLDAVRRVIEHDPDFMRELAGNDGDGTS